MKILHLVLYDKLYPAKNGGMLRCWNLAKQLSIHFDTDVLCLQPDLLDQLRRDDGREQFLQMKFITPEFSKTPKKAGSLTRIKSAIRHRWVFGNFTNVNALNLALIPLLEKIDKKKYDVIVFEHLYALSLSMKLRKLFPTAAFILDAHNIDHLLIDEENENDRFRKVKMQESTLSAKCNMVFACSDSEAQKLRKLNGDKIQVVTVPNGVDSTLNPVLNREHADGNFNLIFCGSMDYEPNYNGICWFLNHIWPVLKKAIPIITFSIIGRGRPPVKMLNLIKNEERIKFSGEVNDVMPYYQDAHIAVVPLLQGSGTRLKILEAMSLGIPVISTSVGAEGINYTDMKNIIIADTQEQFIQSLTEFHTNPEKYANISENGRELIDTTYSWDVIGNKLSEVLNAI